MRQTRTLLLLLTVVFGVVAPLGSAHAGAPAVNQTHQDKVHKFSFKFFKGWKPVPLQAGEEHIVCRMRDPKNKGALRDTVDPSIEVVRVRIEGSDEVVTGSGEEEMPSFGPKIEDAYDATIGDDLAPYGRPAPKNGPFSKDKFKETKSKDKPKLIGKLYAGSFDAPNYTRPVKLFVMLAVFEKNGVQLGIYCKCGEPLRKNYERAFKKVIKSFKFFDKKADDVESLDILDGVNISAKRRRHIETSLVAGWDVIVSPKKNYVVVYNTKNNKNNQLAKTIASRIEKIREQVYEVQFPPSQPIKAVSIVRVCENASEYHAFGGPGGSAGYWSSGSEELVFYDASPSKKIDDDTISVLYHEAFHQYIYYSVGDVAPHSWFNEGHGDYYAGAVYKRGKFKIKPFAWRQGVIRNATAVGPRTFETIEGPGGKKRKKWAGKGYTPLQYLVNFTQREYYSYPSVCYAQGWSLIYFLREIVPKKKKWNEKWGHILDVYFNTLKAEVAKTGKLVPMGLEVDEDDDEEDEEGDGEDKDPPTTGEGGDEEDGDKEDGDEKEGDKPVDIEELLRKLGGLGGRDALDKAVKKAFEGVDWEELEKAWLKAPAG